jgi:hypothetical protein
MYSATNEEQKRSDIEQILHKALVREELDAEGEENKTHSVRMENVTLGNQEAKAENDRIQGR